MPKIKLRTKINAPIERVFDLARSIDLHLESAAHTDETAIAGKTSGLIGHNETVTWRAKHFGMYHKLTSKITEFNSPHFFVDEMTKGIFNYLRHEHQFKEVDGDTILEDTFYFQSPMGMLGLVADKLFVQRHLSKFLKHRNTVIKDYAESDKWKTILKT